MKSLTVALSNHFQGVLTTIATCWKVSRRDGVVLGFTDHDVSINLEGLTYVASSGYFRSAIANSATTAVDNLEVRGFLDNNLISEIDLRNGAYDFAEVEIFAINWNDLTQGICRLRYGYFGEVNLRPSGLFVVELRGLMQLLSQTVGETISPDCRADLGDRRCKFKLLPDIRNSSRAYTNGERVIVPGETINTAIGLPLQNPMFDWYQNASYYDVWNCSNGVVTNYPNNPRSGLYYVRPTAATGYVRREIKVDLPGGLNDLELGGWARATEGGWLIGGVIELLERTGLFGLIVNVVHTIEIPYQPITPGVWGHFGDIIEDYAVAEEVNSIRVTVRWRPGPTNPTDFANIRIDDIYFVRNHVPFEDPYMAMNLPNPASTAGAQGWTGNFLRTDPGNINIVPSVGHSFLTCTQWTFNSASQVINIIAAGANQIEVDAGLYGISGTILAAGLEWGSTSRITFEFLNGANALISSITTGDEDLSPAHQWLERTLTGAVPPLTRSIRVRLNSSLAATRTSGNPSGAYDSVSVSMYHADSDTANLLQYHGVEYVCTDAGTTAATQPGTFTHTIGEVITDGGVTWQCVAPAYTFTGQIDEVINNQIFTVPGINAPDNFFKWGVLTFLDGGNRTRGVEVLSWNNSNKRMRIMLPALVPIAPGTNIRVHAGCDKTRGLGGCGKFNNILNYRGEPEVPGTDQYFRVGGTGS